MANDKKKHYYWIKLSGDFFRDKLIKRLRKISGGDTFVIIYLKMLVLAAESEGKLYYDGFDEDFSSDLALDIDENVDDVRVTVNYLVSHGILVSNTEEEFELITVKEMTGSETDSARRTRKYRLRLSQRDMLPSQCDANVRESDTETETESDTETDSETERETDGRTGPTLAEVKAYALLKNSRVDPERFYSYNKARGWRTKEGPVKDWKALFNSWETSEYGKKEQSSGNGSLGLARELAKEQAPQYVDVSDEDSPFPELRQTMGE